MKKTELIALLVEEYGYSENDLKDKEGKPFTNAKLKAMIEAENKDAEQAEIDSTRIKAEVSDTLKDEDKIKVMSGSSGGVFYKSEESRRIWRFERFGQMTNMPYGELVTIQNRFPIYFREGLIVVLDKQVQEEFGLTEMYKNILTPERLNELLKKDLEEIKTVVRSLPEGMKLTFVNKVQEMYNSVPRQLDSLSIVEFVENEFGISMKDNAPIEEYALKNKDSNPLNIIYVDKK
jgi:hypothetical protein